MTTPQRTRRNRRTVERMSNTAVAYLRVSTDKQVDSGAGLAAQRAAVVEAAARRGLVITDWYVEEAVSGKLSPLKRPAMSRALEALAAGPASVLLFAKADRAGRSALDLLKLRERAESEGWTMMSADGVVDLTTAAGRMIFTQLAAVAEFERELISARTKEALAIRKAQGVRLGHPATLPDSVLRLIIAMRAEGASYRAIAAALEADGVQTARGGSKWHASSVRSVYEGQDAQALRTAA